MKPVLRPASSLSLAELTNVFNDSYADYVVPMPRYEERLMRWLIDTFDVDLDASRIAVADGVPVGFVNLALRGDQAWIGGLGVVPQARRQGLGELLMRAAHDEARARAVERVWLEVIVQNEGASLLYEKLGYRAVRDLEVWTLNEDGAPGSAREVPVAQAHERIRALRTAREPWQRADATLAHHDDAVGLETDAGAAVFRPSTGIHLLQIAGDDHEELLRALRSRGPVIALNIPLDDPAAEALRALGGTASVRQREMLLELGPD